MSISTSQRGMVKFCSEIWFLKPLFPPQVLLEASAPVLEVLVSLPLSLSQSPPPPTEDVTNTCFLLLHSISLPPSPGLCPLKACHQLDCTGQVPGNGSPTTAPVVAPTLWGVGRKSLEDSLFRMWPLIPVLFCFLFPSLKSMVSG